MAKTPNRDPRSPNTYASGPLDRADHRRPDSDWLAARLADPETRFVPVWRARNRVTAVSERMQAVWVERHLVETHLLERETVFLGLETAGEGEGPAYVAVDLSHLEEEEAEALAGVEGSFRDLREVGPLLASDEAAVLAYARGLLHWHRRHGFCGVCGAPTESDHGGHLRRCSNPDCGASHFPRTDPAVIMLVHDGREGGAARALLGRQRIWPPGMHSTLAGFVEPGESLEDAVAREVMEEVGIPVEDVTYHSSQPWPFPSSIMLGFHARALADAIRPLDQELESAGWYSRDQLRASPEDETFRLPRRDSIARRLIEDWLAEE